MIDVLSADDVRRQDAASEAAGTPVGRLMDRAGWAVARAARGLLGGTYGRRVALVCGKGNNAGDALVAGRILAAQGGHVTAIMAAGTERLSPLCDTALRAFPGRATGLDALPRELERADLLVDGIFGVGLARPPEGAPAEAIREMAHHATVLSVDIPSGVDADSGRVLGVAVRATATVTFSGFKPGLLFEPGASHAGHVDVADIGGVPIDATACVLERDDARARWPRRSAADNKRRAGTVLVVAGSRAMPGAAALTTGAAIRSGAGLTVLCAPEEVCRVALVRHPEITTIPVPETGDGTIDPKALELLRPRLGEFHAAAIGPGLSTHPAAVETVRALLEELQMPVVLDADGLNASVGALDILRSRPGPTVITPHAGELGRLLGMPPAALDGDRLSAARTASETTGCVVVFKGPGTVIDDGHERYINPTGGAALAQGGTGDVLTGMLGSLIAQRAARHAAVDARAVAAGVWVHGAVADRASVGASVVSAGRLIENVHTILEGA